MVKDLEKFPAYEPGKPPQWYRYHAEVGYLDELEKIWGKRWGAQGIGKLREVAMVRPTEVEVLPLYDQDPNYFLMHTEKPDLAIMADMFIAPVDVRLALIYPPWCDYNVIRRLLELGYRLIEVPQDEQMKCFVCNALTLEPGRVMVIKGCPKTVKALRKEKVDVIEVPYDEVMKYGGGIRCTTMQLIRDKGPSLFEAGEARSNR